MVCIKRLEVVVDSLDLVVATSNVHKLTEMRSILQYPFHLIGMSELGYNEDIPEIANTLEGNALIKARYLFQKTNLPCIADDSGLEVYALNNAPGVFSARYAGAHCSSHDNVQLLLSNLRYVQDRTAQFRTVIALIWNQNEYIFEGIVRGSIALEMSGCNGFGYDPLFIPEGWKQSFAEVLPEIKNKISHRAIALNKLKDFLLQA